MHLLRYDSLDYKPASGWFLNMPSEKVVRVSGSRVPLPAFMANIWVWFVRHVRPILMSHEQREAWNELQNCNREDKVTRLRHKRQVDKHLFYDTKGNGAGE